VGLEGAALSKEGVVLGFEDSAPDEEGVRVGFEGAPFSEEGIRVDFEGASSSEEGAPSSGSVREIDRTMTIFSEIGPPPELY